MGGESTPSRAVVQSAGYGYRLKPSIVKREFALGGNLQHLALRYSQALITQTAQTAVCNRHIWWSNNCAAETPRRRRAQGPSTKRARPEVFARVR